MGRYVRLFRCVSVCFTLLVASISGACSARVYTTGNSDGTIGGTSWYFHGGTTLHHQEWTTTNNSALYCYSYSRSDESGYNESGWDDAVLLFDATSCRSQGAMSSPVKLWFYSFTMPGTRLCVLDQDRGGTVAYDLFAPVPHTLVSTVNAGEGWISVDVTSQIRSRLGSGFSWVGFEFVCYGSPGGRLAASEDTQGRGAYLEIVPEPSGSMAFLVGVTGLASALVRRRR